MIYDNVIEALRAQGGVVHITASGSGTLIQDELWKTPGASAWMSGASFPYDPEETNEFLGFKSTGVNHDTAVHLACVAYMKAYRFGRKLPIGVGITTSVASMTAHRGDHRVHACIITPTACYYCDVILEKKTGALFREIDNIITRDVAFTLLEVVLGIPRTDGQQFEIKSLEQSTLLDMVMERPVFHESGLRSQQLPNHVALMPGAYDPPHEGHFGIADAMDSDFRFRVFHHITIDQPHKPHLTAQDVLQRAKLLRHRNVIFTRGDALYIDKIRKFGLPIVMGTDALDRILDPKWGVPTEDLLSELYKLNAKIFVNGRITSAGTFETCEDVLDRHRQLAHLGRIFFSLGNQRWDISSTEVRNAALSGG